MIAAQHQDVFRVVALHDVDILEQGIGGALVPLLLGGALLRWQDFHELADLGAHETPGALQVTDQ